MNRADLFVRALKKSKEALKQSPFMFPLDSIIKQLEYLIEVENGKADKTKLVTISIGQIAARDIEEFDEKLADLLHEVSSEVHKMKK